MKHTPQNEFFFGCDNLQVEIWEDIEQQLIFRLVGYFLPFDRQSFPNQKSSYPIYYSAYV